MIPIQELLQAIDAGDKTKVATCLTKRKRLLKHKGDKGQSLLHRAARSGHVEVVKELMGRGLSAALVDSEGNTPLHDACHIDVHSDPADVIRHLLANGGDLKTVNGKGQTAAHVAAFTGKLACLTEMANNGDFALASGADGRGWTAMDIAGAAGKSAIEDFLSASGHAATPPLVPTVGPPLSTIDILMAATKAETPEMQNQMRGHYEDLYRNPDFRPILDLAAADAMGGRGAGGKKALRIYVGQTDFAGDLTGKGGYGAFDPDSNTLALGGQRPIKELLGTVIHELTHHAADVVYGAKAVPYNDENSVEAQSYRDAIAGDVKQEHLLKYQSDGFDAVSETISGRIAGYTARMPSAIRQRETALQEFLVGVPQAIYQHGEPMVSKVSPNLLAYFKGEFKSGCETTRGNHTGFNARVDNTTLINNLAPLPPAPSAPASWINMKHKSLQMGTDLADLIITQQRVAHGGAPGPIATTGGPVPAVLHNPALLSLPEQGGGGKAYYDKRSALAKALQGVMADMPPEMSEKQMSDFLEEAADLWESGVDQDTLAKNVAAKAQQVVRATRLEYLKRAKDKDRLTPELVAETVIYEAAFLALEKDPERAKRLDPGAGPDMKDSKFKDLIKGMAKSLKPEKIQAFLDDPTELTKAATALATGPSGAFFTKDMDRWENKVLKQRAGHVSIDAKDAKRIWLEQLANLQVN